MKTTIHHTLALLGLLAFASHASALEPADTAGAASGSLGLRFGSDDLNLGFGGRAGYTLDFGLYVGGMGEYFLGTSDDAGGVETSFSAWMLGGEVGYDLGVAQGLVIRPALTIALAGVTAEVCVNAAGLGGGCTDGSDEEMDIGIGAQGLYNLGGLQLGAELRYMVKELEAIIFGANVGMIF